MPRPPSQSPTDRELDILNVLWKHKSASLSEIRTELAQERDVAASTVATLLKIMDDKGFVTRTSDRRWKAVISQAITGGGLISRLLDSVFDGSVRRLVAQVVDSHPLSADEIEELQELLEEHRSQNQAARGNRKAT